MNIIVNIRTSNNTGTLKAYADVQVHFSASVLNVHGLRVVETDQEKGPWVAYPQQQSSKGKKKWYDIVKITGKLHDEISSAVLKEYAEAQAKGSPSNRSSVPRAQIPREPGEEAPF
jgi:DNA-binding cell septation regulator SpoVG